MIALLCGVLFCGCKKDKDKEAGNFPSIETVANLMPGGWVCTKSYEPEDVGYELDFVPRYDGAYGGTCYINGVAKDWELEPVYPSDFEDGVSGCATSIITGGVVYWWFVYAISSTEMEWRLIDSGNGWNDKIGNDVMKFERMIY